MQTSQHTRFCRVTYDFKPYLTISQHGLVFTRRWLGNNSWIKQIKRSFSIVVYFYVTRAKIRWTTPEQCCYQGSTTLVEFTMLMSIVRSIVVWCWQRTIVVTMLLEHELTIVDEKSLLIVVNNDWTMVVECEQLWTMVVDNSCWQGEAQHCWTVCSTTLQQVVDNIDQVVHFFTCRRPLVSNHCCINIQ